MEDIRNKTFKNVCTCGQKLALFTAMAIGTTGAVIGGSKFLQENKGKPLVGVVEAPREADGGVNGYALLTFVSTCIAGVSAANLRKMTKDQGRQ